MKKKKSTPALPENNKQTNNHQLHSGYLDNLGNLDGLLGAALEILGSENRETAVGNNLFGLDVACACEFSKQTPMHSTKTISEK